MDGLAFLGLVLILYAVLVVYIAVKKPPVIWDMKKIEVFKKMMGEKGTVIFFYILALISTVIGVWLMVRK